MRQPAVLASVLGLLLILWFLASGVRGAILLGILATTAIGAIFGLVHYQGLFSTQLHLAVTFGKFDLRGLLAVPPARLGAAIFVLFYLALFDIVGTLVGVGHQAGLVQEGRLPRVGRALFASAVGTTAGAVMGTSTITCYIESAAGVSDGARTGLASVATSLLLAASLFFSPLASMIGGGVKLGHAVLYPTLAPALIVVGSMMIKALRELPWDDPTEYLPAFLVLVGIPLTFSIASGIAFGLIAYAVAKLATGRWRECPTLTYIFAVLFVVQFLIL